MALIRCPECGREISSLSSACVHCGYPLFQHADDTPPCSLVLMDIQPEEEELVCEHLCREFHMSRSEAEACLNSLPAVLLKGVPAAQAYEAANAAFRDCGTTKVVLDSDTGSAESIFHAKSQPNKRARRRPLSFWTIVGAILTAFALWWLITTALSALVVYIQFVV